MLYVSWWSSQLRCSTAAVHVKYKVYYCNCEKSQQKINEKLLNRSLSLYTCSLGQDGVNIDMQVDSFLVSRMASLMSMPNRHSNFNV